MKRSVITLLFTLLAATATYADTIHYDTTPGSVFNCTNSGSLAGCSTSQVTVGGTILLTYVPVSTSVDVFLPGTPSSNANFGNIVVSCVDLTNTCDAQSIAVGDLTFTLQINQTGPDVLNGTIAAATIFGSIGGSNSAALIQWNNGTFVHLIGVTFDDTYSIQNTTLGLVAPSTGGTTTIQGQVIAAAVPEPAVSMLFATGLLAIGTIRRRK